MAPALASISRCRSDRNGVVVHSEFPAIVDDVGCSLRATRRSPAVQTGPVQMFPRHGEHKAFDEGHEISVGIGYLPLPKTGMHVLAYNMKPAIAILGIGPLIQAMRA
jgi:hypothetical protein